tara:strand:- start:33 stop:311 length:279 start_codon:yes stop_codon:yes gene_type:complete
VLYCLQNPKSTIFGLPIPLVALQVIDLLEQLLVQVFSARTIRFQNQKTCLQNPKSTIFGLPIQLVLLQDFMRIRINQDLRPENLMFLQNQRI